MALTDTWLKANNGKERAALEERSDRDEPGVRVTPTGKITFQLRYRYDGSAKRLDLGSYPHLYEGRDFRVDGALYLGVVGTRLQLGMDHIRIVTELWQASDKGILHAIVCSQEQARQGAGGRALNPQDVRENLENLSDSAYEIYEVVGTLSERV